MQTKNMGSKPLHSILTVTYKTGNIIFKRIKIKEISLPYSADSLKRLVWSHDFHLHEVEQEDHKAL